jgi:hypothetical protein
VGSALAADLAFADFTAELAPADFAGTGFAGTGFAGTGFAGTGLAAAGFAAEDLAGPGLTGGIFADDFAEAARGDVAVRRGDGLRRGAGDPSDVTATH